MSSSALRLGHLADIHIRNVRYHDRYIQVFESLYKSLRDNKVDLICVCGDVAHTKETLSAEFFEMASDFFRNLCDIAPTVLIPGNHDANLSNLRRQDALSPIVNALRLPNLHYMKHSGILDLTEDFGINMCHLSVFDDRWDEEVYSKLDSESVNIALYHGVVDGSRTDVGHALESDVGPEMFEEFDFALLGDIHKRQSVDDVELSWYPGSLIQQNYGESPGKGYLLWYVDPRVRRYDSKFIELPDPTPFVTFYVSKSGVVSDMEDPPKGSYGRFKIQDEMTHREISDVISPVVKKYRLRDKSIIREGGSSLAQAFLDDHVDYRDPEVQRELIQVFCKKRGVCDTLRDRVLELHSDVLKNVTIEDDCVRNTTFDIDRLEFNNMFSYGEGNAIDLSTMDGVIGIFGPNAIGKSAIVDSMLLCAFNTMSRRIPSPAFAVNNRRESGDISLWISNGETQYKISREYLWKESGAKGASERGKSTTKVTFHENDVDETGTQRQKTDTDVIRPRIGSFDDYVTTSVSPQDQIHRFIYMTESPRKDYLMKILDLSFFDELHSEAKSMALPIKSVLKKNRTAADIDLEIELMQEQIEALSESEKVQSDECGTIRSQMEQVQAEIVRLESAFSLAKRPKYNPDEVRAELEACLKNQEVLESGLERLSDNLRKTERELSDSKATFEKALLLEDVISEQQAADFKDRLAAHDETEKMIQDLRKKMERHSSDAELLDTVPCGDSFPACKFIAKAHESKGLVPELEVKMSELNKVLVNQSDTDNMLVEISNRQSRLSEVEELRKELECLGEKSNDLRSNHAKGSERLRLEKEKASLLESKLEHADAEKLLFESVGSLTKSLEMQNSIMTRLRSDLSSFEKQRSETLVEIGKAQKSIEHLSYEKEGVMTAERELESYELLIECMSRNGIVQQILQKLQPLINIEINDILSNVVDFQVKFDLEDPKFRIYLEEPNKPRRHIELASGFERMVSSLAIRVALIKLSTLPKFSTLVIDEGFGALDEEHRLSMGRMFDSLKERFKNIVVITHVDSIKDSADHILSISVDEDGFSSVRQQI